MSRMGDEISRLRKEVGMTQKQLAKAVGVAEGFIIDVESGKRVLNEDLIKRITKALRQEVGKLDTFDAGEYVRQPEPDRKIVKVIEKPVQDIWNEALSGVIMSVPIYSYDMDKVLDTKKLPIIGNQVEGYPKDKVFYLIISDNEMAGFRVHKGDRALVYTTGDIEKDTLYFIELKGKKVLRQIKRLDGEKILLLCNDGTLKTETVSRKDIKVIARLIRLEILYA